MGREEGCWSLAGESPVREIVIAPGSSRDSRAGNQTAEALDGKGRLGRLREHAGRNVSERRAGLEKVDAEADPATQWGRPPPSGRKGGTSR